MKIIMKNIKSKMQRLISNAYKALENKLIGEEIREVNSTSLKSMLDKITY